VRGKKFFGDLLFFTCSPVNPSINYYPLRDYDDDNKYILRIYNVFILSYYTESVQKKRASILFYYQERSNKCLDL
jgi:hypothetical protein